MRRIKKDSSEVVGEVVRVLRVGGVVVYPSETCYGLAADWENAVAVEKVFMVKRRSVEKKVLVLVGGVEEVERVAQWTELGRRLAERFWPGALTLVLPAKDGEETVAVRVPGDEFSQKVLEQSGMVLVSTSANVSGAENAYSVDEVWGLEVDLVVDGGVIPKRMPTTVVDCTGEKPKILRLGEVGEEELLEEAEDAGGEA